MSKVRDINLAVFPTARSKPSHLLNVNPLQPGAVYLYPLKTSENLKGFLMFSGGIDKQHQAVMG